MASDLLMLISFAHAEIAAIISLGNRAPNKGSFPVAGLPLFLGLTFIDFAIKRLYLKREPGGSTNFCGSKPQGARHVRHHAFQASSFLQIRPLKYPVSSRRRYQNFFAPIWRA
jgi:hypothetical protein